MFDDASIKALVGSSLAKLASQQKRSYMHKHVRFVCACITRFDIRIYLSHVRLKCTVRLRERLANTMVQLTLLFQTQRQRPALGRPGADDIRIIGSTSRDPTGSHEINENVCVQEHVQLMYSNKAFQRSSKYKLSCH